MTAAHQWAVLYYSCQHCCLLVLRLINPLHSLCAAPCLRTRYCLFRLVSQSPCIIEVRGSFCKDELAPLLNTEALTRQLRDGVISCLLYPAGILVINLYAKQLPYQQFDMEVCSCRRTMMTLYHLLLTEMSSAKGFHPKVNFLSLKHMFAYAGAAAVNVHVKSASCRFV